METKDIAQKIAAAANDKKAKDILLLNMEGLSPVTDFYGGRHKDDRKGALEEIAGLFPEQLDHILEAGQAVVGQLHHKGDGLALTACNPATDVNVKETGDKNLIGKSDIRIKDGRMTPEALWAMG